MRKVTQNSINAFLARKSGTFDNTSTDGDALFLFGNKIAEHRADGIYITTADWASVTTKERLKGLGADVYTRKHVLHLDDKPWDGSWTKL